MYKIATCTAPVNIAVIKYWGKKDENLVLPLNDSISFTLNQKEMRSKTTIMISPNFKSDRIWINNREESVTHPRIANCLKEVRRRGAKRKHDDVSEDKSLPSNWHMHICSENNFPTAAGLASSAAGYACLVYTLCKLYNIEGNISTIARLGSGSACRSLYGGLVRWHKGESEDGEDSFAEQIAPSEHWPDLHVIICIANVEQKKTSSTEGMKRSVRTSFFLKCRIENSVKKRIEAMLEAIKDKNWSSFCDLTMADSNEMHAVCLNTFPPCVYMNDSSHRVEDFVHEYNAIKIGIGKEEEKICYTFDAGPNACLFVPGKVTEEVSILLTRCFPACYSNSKDISKDNPYWQGVPISSTNPTTLKDFEQLIGMCEQKYHSIKYFLHTSIGDGPQSLPDENSTHLINPSTGLPIFTEIEETTQKP